MTESTCAHCGGLVDEHGLTKLPAEEGPEAMEMDEMPSEPPPDEAVEQLFTEALKERR